MLRDLASLFQDAKVLFCME